MREGAPRRRLAALIGVPLLVAVVGTAATLGGTAVVRGSERERLTALTERRTEQIGGAVEDELARYGDLATSSKGLYEASDRVTPSELDAFVDSVDLAARYPGASTVGFLVPTDDAGVAEVERLTAGAAPTDLDRVTVPDGTHFVTTAARRADGTPPDLGLDLSAAPEPERALLRARDQGTPVLSETYVLLRDRVLPVAEQQRGAVLVAPLYQGGATPPSVAERRRRLRGWVYIAFRGADFLRDTLDRVTRLSTWSCSTDRRTPRPSSRGCRRAWVPPRARRCAPRSRPSGWPGGS